jgi:hypothetical protein
VPARWRDLVSQQNQGGHDLRDEPKPDRNAALLDALVQLMRQEEGLNGAREAAQASRMQAHGGTAALFLDSPETEHSPEPTRRGIFNRFQGGKFQRGLLTFPENDRKTRKGSGLRPHLLRLLRSHVV